MLGNRNPPGDGGATCIAGTFVSLAGFGDSAVPDAGAATAAPDAPAGAAPPTAAAPAVPAAPAAAGAAPSSGRSYFGSASLFDVTAASPRAC